MIRRAALAFVLIWSAYAQQPRVPTRELPLNRFPQTRSTAASFYAMPTAIGDDYADGKDPASRVARHLKTARRLGVKYLRCAFSWNGIEPEQGRYDWTFWDNLVSAAEKSRIGLIPYVAYTPKWAARDPHDFWKQPPRDPRLYSDFMNRIVSRYRGRIRSWEIWNEPDNKDYWTGTAAEFASLATLAARSIREADPAAVLVLGGMANGPGEFLRSLLTAHHIDRYVDVVAVHAYPESWLNERAETIFDDWIPAIRSMIDENRSGADLWLNEMGYADYRLSANSASIYGTSVFYRYEHTPDYQAAMLFKLHLLTAASPVSLSGWYRIDDFPHSDTRIGTDLVNHHLGVLDVRGRPKPAFCAMRFYNRILRAPSAPADTPVVRPPASQAVVKVFRTAGRRAVIAAWLRSSRSGEIGGKSGMLADGRAESLSIDLPCRPSGKLRFYDPQGRRTNPRVRLVGSTIGNVLLTGDKVFIAEAACAP